MARILIADDDPHASEMIARICEYKGHQVHQVRDAVQALQGFESFHPDLVITDLAMPLGGGQKLVQDLRERPDGSACPVIVITGYASLLGSGERESLQPCTILEKPLQLEPMLAALDEALGATENAG